MGDERHEKELQCNPEYNIRIRSSGSHIIDTLVDFSRPMKNSRLVALNGVEAPNRERMSGFDFAHPDAVFSSALGLIHTATLQSGQASMPSMQDTRRTQFRRVNTHQARWLPNPTAYTAGF